MKLSHIGELSIAHFIRERFNVEKRDVLIGIGDDTAAVRVGDRIQLITTDLMTEGIHFDLSYFTPYQLGFKLISINVSDIFAMYGEPEYALLSLAFPPDTDNSILNEFFSGVSFALKRYSMTLIGGDVSSSRDGVTISATVIGFAGEPITRAGARIGDRIYVTGTLGDAACGLELLRKMNRQIHIERGETVNTPYEWKQMKPLLTRHLMPSVNRPSLQAERIHAMMDISDGLLIDLKRLCMENNLGARIYEEKLPLSDELMQIAPYLDMDPVHLGVCGGEDFEYLFVSPHEVEYARCIGEVIEHGFKFIDREERELTWAECGYEHFKD